MRRLKLLPLCCLVIINCKVFAQPNNPLPLLIDKTWRADRRNASGTDIKSDSLYKFLDPSTNDVFNLKVVQKGKLSLKEYSWAQDKKSSGIKIFIVFQRGKPAEPFEYLFEESDNNKIVFRTPPVARQPKRFGTIITLSRTLSR